MYMKKRSIENIYCCIIAFICIVICSISYYVLGDTYLCISLISMCTLSIVWLLAYIIAETVLYKVRGKLHV